MENSLMADGNSPLEGNAAGAGAKIELTYWMASLPGVVTFSDELDDEGSDDRVEGLSDGWTETKAQQFLGKLKAHFDICGMPYIDATSHRHHLNQLGYEADRAALLLIVPLEIQAGSNVCHHFNVEGLIQLRTDEDKCTVRGYGSNSPYLTDGDGQSLVSVDEFMQVARRQSAATWAPSRDEDQEAWIKRVLISEDTLIQLWERWEKSGYNIDIFARIGPRAKRPGGIKSVEELASGAVPYGIVSALIGPNGIGKSTVCMELAALLGTPGASGTWLGRKVNQRENGGLAVYALGEDSEETADDLLSLLDPKDKANSLIIVPKNIRPLSAVLSYISTIPNVSALFIDPARKYLVGDEDSSASVSEFFSLLEDFASNTKAAVIVVHHMKKDASPSSLDQIKSLIRGSAVWTDRPRVVLGMYRKGGLNRIGVIKCNLPPQYEMMAETAFEFDRSSAKHVPADSNHAGIGTDISEAERVQNFIIKLVQRQNANKATITRTGRDGVFETKAPELEGVPRAQVRAATDRLIALGVISDGPGGLRALPAVTGDDRQS
jgi:hypothetical protein